MSPQTLAKLLTIFVGLVGLIYAGEDSFYSYWKPDNSAYFHEDANQSLQSVSHEKQDFANPNRIGKFISGIQNRQFGGSLGPLLAGAIAVVGVGAIIYNDNLSNTNRLKDEDTLLAARVKALESDGGLAALATRVSAVESSSSSATTQAAANCAKLKEVTDVAAGANDAATIASIIAVTSNTC